MTWDRGILKAWGMNSVKKSQKMLEDERGKNRKENKKKVSSMKKWEKEAPYQHPKLALQHKQLTALSLLLQPAFYTHAMEASQTTLTISVKLLWHY